MAGEYSKMQVEIAARAAGMQMAALKRVLDAFGQDAAALENIANQIFVASENGKLQSVIDQSVMPAVQQIMQMMQQPQQGGGQPPQGAAGA